jgi:hypothetical protein
MSERWLHFREWLADMICNFVCVAFAVSEPQCAECAECGEPIEDPGEAIIRHVRCGKRIMH